MSAYKVSSWEGFEGLLSELECIMGHRHAATFHDAIAERLESWGYRVKREFAVVIGDGVGGRVDIVADKDGGYRIALELDNRSPRGKSILKLQTFLPTVLCAVLLRNPY